MAIVWINRVLVNSKAPAAARAVLFALADRADETGRCWPAIRDIMGRSGMKTERGVQKALAALVRLGELTIEHGGGRHRPNSYTLTIPEPETPNGAQGFQYPEQRAGVSTKKPRTPRLETPNTAPQNPERRAAPTVIEPSEEPPPPPLPLQTSEPAPTIKVEVAELREKSGTERDRIERLLINAGVMASKADDLAGLPHVTLEVVRAVLRDRAKGSRAVGWAVNELRDPAKAAGHAKRIADDRRREQAERDADAARAETERRIEAAYEAYHSLSPADRDALYRRACVGLPDDWLARSTPELPARAVRERIAELYRPHRNGHAVGAGGAR